MSLEIDLVSHCWHYSRSLAYQISGLILDPPDFPVQLTIFCNPEDKDTINTIQTLYPKLPPTVCLVPRAQDKPKLFRRGIGRNDACLGTLAASVVICTDCDYVWGAKALREVLENYQNAPLSFPHHYMKQKSHELGDACLALQETPQVLGLNPDDFDHCRIGKAIGGIQVIRADLAREHGYLNGTRWMTPHNGPRFASCRDDRGYRCHMANLGYIFTDFDGGEPWRIRHGRKGRIEDDIAN